jgi:hypothetical protein
MASDLQSARLECHSPRAEQQAALGLRAALRPRYESMQIRAIVVQHDEISFVSIRVPNTAAGRLATGVLACGAGRSRIDLRSDINSNNIREYRSK